MWVLSKIDKQGLGAGCRVLCKDKVQGLGAKVWCSVRVLCGAKQTSKGLAWCKVLCKDKVRVPSR